MKRRRVSVLFTPKPLRLEGLETREAPGDVLGLLAQLTPFFAAVDPVAIPVASKPALLSRSVLLLAAASRQYLDDYPPTPAGGGTVGPDGTTPPTPTGGPDEFDRFDDLFVNFHGFFAPNTGHALVSSPSPGDFSVGQSSGNSPESGSNSTSTPGVGAGGPSSTGDGGLFAAAQGLLAGGVGIPAPPLGSPVVISQVYGGGGGTGAAFDRDFVELYNRGAAAISLDGWSVQYADQGSTSWQVAALSGTLQPGQYLLVAQTAAGSHGAALPTPNVLGLANLDPVNGKVALVQNVSPLPPGSPIGVADLVGYGSAEHFEAMPVGPLNPATAALRHGGGAVDTDHNANDFAAGVPSPRNGATQSASFSWSVGAAAQSPTVAPPADRVDAEGTLVDFAVTANDPGGLPLTYEAVGLPLGLSIDPATGVISGTVDHRAADRGAGVYRPAVFARNSMGLSSGASFIWEVTEVNRTPALDAVADQTSTAGAVVSLQLAATDPDGEPLVYGAAGLPDGLMIDVVTGEIAGTLAPSQPTGTYAVTVTASDLDLTATRTFTWSVAGLDLPLVAQPADRTDREGDVVSLQVSATDPQGRPMTYNAEGLPSGLSIDAAGSISGTLEPGAADDGPYEVRVTASADGYLTAGVRSFSWEVTPYVSLTVPADQSSDEGDAVSLSVTASAPSGAAVLDAEGLPPGLTFDPATGTIAGTIASGASQAGEHLVAVTAAVGPYETTKYFSWSVGRVGNASPTLTDPGSQTGTLGGVVSLQLLAADADGDALRFSATGLPGGLSLDPTTGEIIGSFDDDGVVQTAPYAVVVTVADGHGGTASRSFDWTVSGGPLVVAGSSVMAVEGHALANVLVGTLTGPTSNRPAGVYSVAISWGDGTTTPGTVIGEKGEFEVYGSHTYRRPGTYSIQLTAEDPTGGTASATAMASVSAAGHAASGATVATVVGSAVERELAYFEDENALDSASSYDALIDWGDGSPPTPGVVRGFGGRFSVSGGHAYAVPGDYAVLVALTDQDGATTLAFSDVAVGDVYAGLPADLAVSFSGGVPPGATATVHWGDGNSTLASIEPGQSGFVVRASHGYAAEGQYAVSVAVAASGGSLYAAGSVRAARAPVATYSAPVAANLAGTFEGVELGKFTDPNAAHTAADYQALVEWGDGTSSSGVISAGPNGVFAITGSHEFAQDVTKPLAVRLLWRGVALQAEMPRELLPAPQVQRISFLATLEKNFATWAGTDKKLTRQEVINLFDDFSIKGEDGAALAVLKAYVMDLVGAKRDQLSANVNLFVKDTKGWTPTVGLTAANLAHFEKIQTDSEEPLYLQAANLEFRFGQAIARIAGTNKTLFPPVARNAVNPDFTTVRQGMIGDCSFLSAVIARVNYFEAGFRSRFKETAPTTPNGPRRFEVTFGNAVDDVNVNKERVQEPSDAEIALFATAGAGGLWLTVIEKAYMQLVEAKGLPPLGNLNANADQIVTEGQHLDVPIKLLGGTPIVRRLAISDYKNDAAKRDELQGMMTRALRSKNTVTIDTGPLGRPRQAADLPGQHAFAVLAISDAGVLTIRNPWGSTDLYGGEFEMAFLDFLAKFRFVAIEQYAPPKKKKD